MNSPGSQALLAYAKRGLTYNQVAELLGVKVSTVEYWVRSYGMNKEYQEVKRRALAPEPKPILPCENCGTSEHDGSYGSGRFCGEKCARGFATRNMSEESNKRRIDGLRKANQAMQNVWSKWREENSLRPNKESGRLNKSNRKINRPYPKPNPAVWTNDMKQKARAKAVLRWQDPIYRAKQMENRSERCKVALTAEVREKISVSVKQAMNEGRLSPWQSRGLNMRSYPEQVWGEVLDEYGIEYTPERLIIKSTIDPEVVGNYFLDFFIEINGVKVDLEIDGKQHLIPDRAASDERRDKLLERGGYVIYRIPWINRAHDLEGFRVQVKDLMDFLESLKNG